MRKLGALLLMVWFLGAVSAAHWITGWTEDALDGEVRDGKVITLWNPFVGLGDVVTGVIGVGGLSGVSGVYLIDCEMLDEGCFVGDILSLQILGERYISWVVNVTVTGAGYDLADNVSLNSPPSVEPMFPEDNSFSNGDVDFNCSGLDLDDNLYYVELWGNWSGSWESEGSSQNGFFSKNLVEGVYSWGCYVEDELGIGSWSEINNTLMVDTTSPVISDVTFVNEVCGFGSISIDCEVSDNFEVGNVLVEVRSPEGFLSNYSAGYISNDIYKTSIDLDEAGYWEVGCFANDSAGNLDFFGYESIKVGSGNPEISFGGLIEFDKAISFEGESIGVKVNVTNDGCVDSGEFVVGFFDDGINFANESIFILAEDFLEVEAEWFANIGTSEILVYADSENDLFETEEGDNLINKTAWLKSWQGIYGNVSLDLILGSGADKLGNWSGVESFAGNVFVTDSEADVEWNSLQALGRDTFGNIASDDFGEVDLSLGMGSYNDSIEEIYSDSDLIGFNIFGNQVLNVASVNSSENFVTGILWDTSDSGDLEYDSSEKEDVVFVSEVNAKSIGNYGTYDYEISIPSKLRSYNNLEEERIYLYYDLR